MQFSNFRLLFQDCSKKYSEKLLLRDTLDNSLTFNECNKLVELVSKRLANSGITKNSFVINYSPLSIESVLLCWACLSNGIVFVPVDHNWPLSILKIIVNEIQPSLVLTDRERLATVSSIISSEKIVITSSAEQTQSSLFYDWIDIAIDAQAILNEDIDPNDLAIILYTSGSTGSPKGVMLSQKAVSNSGKLVNEHFNWQSSDVFMNLGDLHSMSGLRNTCITPLFSGTCAIIATSEERNSALYLFEIIEKYEIQFIGTAPTVIRQMNVLYSEKRKEQIMTLKAILCTGGPLARDQMKIFYNLYNKPVFNYYGLTETAGFCSGHNLFTFLPDDNSIGKPVGSEFLIDPETSYNNPSIGELLVKSENLMIGYYNNETETEKVLKNDCFYTGDIVQKRPDGCYELLGRKKNTIKNIHSELIHLEEIDLALEKHHLIREACTCSFASIAEDEKIIAFVVPADVYQDATSFIKDIKLYMNATVGKNRAPWCYYIEEALPRNSSGKIQRQKLTEKLHEYIQSKHPGYF